MYSVLNLRREMYLLPIIVIIVMIILTIIITLLATSSKTKMGFVDDTNLEGTISQVANDVQLIIDSHQHIGLRLNAHKCEIIAKNFELIDKHPIFKDFKHTAKENMTLQSLKKKP